VILVEQLDRLVNSHMYRDSVLFLVSEETVVMGWIFWIFQSSIMMVVVMSSNRLVVVLGCSIIEVDRLDVLLLMIDD
jgi:hypothetical protein